MQASAWCFSAKTALAAACAALLATVAQAAVYHSQEEALALAFPDAERVEKRSFVLTETQAEKVQELAKAPLASKIVTFHIGWKNDRPLGYAQIDVHTVRTLPEALMTVLTPQGKLRSVRVLAFHEPEEYLPPERWFRQFEGKRLGPDLQLKRGIHAVAGSTLSSRATTRSVRRTLALFQVLIGEAEAQEE